MDQMDRHGKEVRQILTDGSPYKIQIQKDT